MATVNSTKVKWALPIASTLREVLVQVWGEVNHKDFGATHLGGNLSNLILLVPNISICKMNNT